MNRTLIFTLLSLFAFLLDSCKPGRIFSAEEEELFKQAGNNGILVNEGFNRCLNFVQGWLKLADPATGLIPRNINDTYSKDIWNAQDCAADNYPFMVLTTALLNPDLFEGRMKEMLIPRSGLPPGLGPCRILILFQRRVLQKGILSSQISSSVRLNMLRMA